jgi:hypothetical protein
MSNDKHTPTPIQQYVQEWINSHEPDTFVKNEYGNYIYSAKHSSLNLAVFFEQILEDYTESLRAEKAELIEALRATLPILKDVDHPRIDWVRGNVRQTLAKYETK